MKKTTALALFLMMTGSHAAFAAPASASAGVAAGSEATTLSAGNSNAVGVGAVGALLGIALATMGGGGSDGS
uniref:exopolysaccharide production protein YjbE n=1 Tax=Erwinia citreus TaxID=558 RepID=UPI002896E58C